MCTENQVTGTSVLQSWELWAGPRLPPLLGGTQGRAGSRGGCGRGREVLGRSRPGL